MSETDIQPLEGRLARGSRSERAGLETTLTKEGLVAKVDQYLETARAHAAGSSRLVLGGAQASGEQLAKVLHEDRLDDERLSGRLVVRLEQQGFGKLSDRRKAAKMKKLDEQIASASAELREARKQKALEEVEREFAGEAA